MTNFYQGSLRAHEILPFLKSKFEEHDWTIVDEDFTTSSWFVMQKVGANGGVMTFAFGESSYPNYGQIGITASQATDMTQDGDGVYVTAYDKTTHTLQHAQTTSGNGWRWYNGAVALPSWGSIQQLSYFSTAYDDSEASPVYVFYKLHIFNDSFYFQIEGNPATTGNAIIKCFGGGFEKTIPELITNDAYGLWGYQTDFYNMSVHLSRINNDTPTASWKVINFSRFIPSSTYLINNNYRTNVFGISDGAHTEYPVIILPKHFIQAIDIGNALVDGNTFIENGSDKCLYYKLSNTNGAIIKVIEGVKDLKLVDDGTGNKISWVNPMQNIAKVAIYARADDYPTDENDANATKIYENTSPVAGDAENFVDTDASRYGNDYYYTVLTFDDATPSPNVSISCKEAQVKANGNSIITFDTHPTMEYKGHPSVPNYRTDNFRKIAPYYKPIMMLPLNESAATTDIVDLMGNYTVTCSVNTDTISETGKTGNALNFSGNKNAVIAAPGFKFDGDFSFQFWYKDTDTTNNGGRTFIGNSNQRMEFRNDYGYTFTANPPRDNYNDNIIRDSDFHFITFVKRGGEAFVYVDGELTNNQETIAINTNITKWNLNEDVCYICSQGNGIWGQFIMENVEVFPYAVSLLQHKNSYNNGTGKMLNVNDYVDGFAAIINPSAVDNKLTATIPSFNATNHNTINFEARASETGTGVFNVVVEGKGYEAIKQIDISVADTWENQTLDISSMSDDFKANIEKISIMSGTSTNMLIASVRNFTVA